jgi:hypothetical protein
MLSLKDNIEVGGACGEYGGKVIKKRNREVKKTKE